MKYRSNLRIPRIQTIPLSLYVDGTLLGRSKNRPTGPSFAFDHIVRFDSTMASLIVGGIFAASAAVFLRTSLRQAAQNGRVLGPIASRLAGVPSSGSLGGSASDISGNWTLGGFQAKMDKNEAAQILGLK